MERYTAWFPSFCPVFVLTYFRVTVGGLAFRLENQYTVVLNVAHDKAD